MLEKRADGSPHARAVILNIFYLTILLHQIMSGDENRELKMQVNQLASNLDRVKGDSTN